MKHSPENGSDKKRGIRLDFIKIKNLEIFAKHGVMPEENALGQKFVISIELECDVRKAGQTDDLNYSVNYAEVASFVTKKATRNTFQLIEKLAEYLAQEILLQYDAVRAVTLEVKKPWAPVHLPLETVSVTVKRQWHAAYLSIGSNMGDKKAHLDMAVESLNKDPWTRVKKVSSYIVTEPVGGVEQDDFLNGAVMLETLRTPEELLELIGRIEQEQKRERIVHWGPRTVDLDIILYDQEIIQTKDLMIPHVEMANRMFVLEPMCEIAPYAKNPLNGCCMLELKEQLQRKEMDS